MFGYVTIRKDDLKVKDYNKYQAYYCGLCQDIKEAYGKKGQAMLTFQQLEHTMPIANATALNCRYLEGQWLLQPEQSPAR